MPCPNCTCQDCAKDQAKDGWTPKLPDGDYALIRDGRVVARVWNRMLKPQPGNWCWGSWDWKRSGEWMESKESAQKAAEEATK